jgi:hypothetical protein
MPCIDVVIADPYYIEVDMKVVVDWYSYKTIHQKSAIHNLLSDAIKSFFSSNITSFTSKFKYSKFITTLSELDKSIDSILTDITLKEYLEPIPNMETSYRFEFLNKIQKGSVKIGSWTVTGDNKVYTIEDKDEDGKLYLLAGDYSKTYIGSVDYDTGVVLINNYKFGTNVSLSRIPVVCKPLMQNINLAKNYLLKLNEPIIEINENE